MFTQKKLTFALLIFILMFVLAPAALAQDDGNPPTPEPPGDTTIVIEEAPAEEAAPTTEIGISVGSVIALLIFLLGFFGLLGGSAGVFISTIVDSLKAFGLVPDKWAALPILLLNFAGIVVLYAVYGLTPSDAIPADLDAKIQLLTNFIATGVALATSLGIGRLHHEKNMKPLSARFSHSAQKPPATWAAASSASEYTADFSPK